MLTGLLSLGLRAVMPLGLAVVGAAIPCTNDSESDYCHLGGAFLGGTVGVLTAIVIDAAYLAYEDVPNEDPTVPRVNIATDQRGAGLVAPGTF